MRVWGPGKWTLESLFQEGKSPQSVTSLSPGGLVNGWGAPGTAALETSCIIGPGSSALPSQAASSERCSRTLSVMVSMNLGPWLGWRSHHAHPSSRWSERMGFWTRRKRKRRRKDARP